jgi:hypothetical protein
MERFRSTLLPQERFKVDIKSHDSLQETVAAITIQRAWRHYRTKELIKRYSKMRGVMQVREDVVPSEHFYGRGY